MRYDGATNTLWLSRIFKWYRNDFRPSVPAFLRRYLEIPEPVVVRYTRYDWRLNRAA